MGPLVALIITIVVISAVVGAIAQFLNKLNEANAPPPRRPAPRRNGGGAGAGRAADKDMDRFLAEIDRLRRKNAEGGDQPQPRPSSRPAPAAVAQPVAPRSAERQRARVVAELAEPQPTAPRRVDQSAMAPPPLAVLPGTLSPDARDTRTEALPVATVVGPTSATGAPAATRVTKLPQRDRPTPKTDLAKNLTGLLGSGQGVAMAIILQEVLGPPKCKK